MYDFRWIEWNIAKCEKHGVNPVDVEFVVQNAQRPHPIRIEQGKRLVWGQSESGEYLQVIYILDDDYTVFVIHAMPLTEKQKRQHRRRQR